MASYPTSPREDFLNWCQSHIKTLSGNSQAIGLSSAQVAAFEQAYNAAANAVATQEEAKNAAKAATETADMQVAALKKAASDTVKVIKTFASTTNNMNVYALAQIPAPDAPSPVAPPGQPTDITVGVSPTTGAITLKWKCENPRGAAGTSYIVRRKTPGQNTFQFVGVTGKKTFTDTTFTAGPDSVQYVVQAQRSDKSGPVSSILTINFGTAPAPVPSTITIGESIKSMKMAA